MSRSIQQHVLSFYQSASTWTRAHIRGRLRLCPFEAMLSFLPAEGRFLEWGCGHGVFCHIVKLKTPKMFVEGYDLSSSKISVAQVSASGKDGIVFRSPQEVPEGKESRDVVAIVDVLYLLSEAEKEAVLDRCVSLLKPGGIILIKEVDTRPFLKFWLTYLEEWVAVRLFGWTLGRGMHYDSGPRLIERLVRRGFSVQRHDLSHGWLHPHLLLVGKKRSSEP